MSADEYYVCAIPFSHCLDKVFLLNKSNSENPRTLLDGIEGNILRNETPKPAMTRVFLEKMGVSIDPSRWFHIGSCKRKDVSIIFYGVHLEKNEIPRTTTRENSWTVQWKNYTQRGWQELGVVKDIPYVIYKAYADLSE